MLGTVLGAAVVVEGAVEVVVAGLVATGAGARPVVSVCSAGARTATRTPNSAAATNTREKVCPRTQWAVCHRVRSSEIPPLAAGGESLRTGLRVSVPSSVTP